MRLILWVKVVVEVVDVEVIAVVLVVFVIFVLLGMVLRLEPVGRASGRPGFVVVLLSVDVVVVVIC